MPDKTELTGLYIDPDEVRNWRYVPRLRWAAKFGEDDAVVVKRTAKKQTGHQPQSPNQKSPEIPVAPEAQRVHPRSQSGRAMYYLNEWRPVHCRAPVKGPSRPPGETEDEQLLYMALYRDKVAQHQMDLAKKRERAEPKGPAAKPAASAGSAPLAGAGGLVAGIKSAREAGGERSAPADDALDSPASSPGHRAGNMALQHAPGSSSKLTATTHIASVTANPTHGGITSEYLETKQLGRLFDLWRKEQEEQLGGQHLTQGGALTRGGSIGRDGSREFGSLSPRAANARDAANLSPRAASIRRERRREVSAADSCAGVSTSSADGDVEAESSEHEADASEHGGARLRGRDRIDRVFTVITNPKVRVESLGERVAGSARNGPDTTHVEGFPTLNLMRLYQGPWRLNV